MSKTDTDRPFKFVSAKDHLPLILSLAATAAMVVFLYFQGRIWWCKSGDYAPYINDAWSTHTSQHLLDPYTFTHVLHGILFFWIASLIFPKLSTEWRFFISIFVEAAWEALENTNFIIDKYRENTAALDYFGDSIFNAVGDVMACAAGIWLALKLGWWRSLAVFVLTELVLIFWIRDSLLINIILLIYPFEALKTWQTGQM